MKTESKVPTTDQQLSDIADITPFDVTDLKGQKFARGNMLGGTVPVQESSTEASWKDKS